MKHRLLISTLIIATACIAVFALSRTHDSLFSRPRLNDGIFVDAPDQWRWCRDGIHLENFQQLAGPPIELAPKVDIEGALRTAKYESDIAGAPHIFSFNSDGYLMFREWYSGISELPHIPAPTPQTPNDLVVSFPRCIPMSWSGQSGHSYQVDVEILIAESGWTHSFTYYTGNSRAIHQHTGVNKGRWKVRSITREGAGAWSDYVNFTCGS